MAVQGFRTRGRDTQMDVAAAFEDREEDRMKSEERIEETLAKTPNKEISRMMEGITTRTYKRREGTNFTATQRSIEDEK